MIQEFKGEYRFLSNFYPRNINYCNVVYPSTEHMFQALKDLRPEVRVAISKLSTPGDAKRAGRGNMSIEIAPGKFTNVVCREDWNKIRVSAMELCLRLKFYYSDLAMKLMSTVPHELVEGNWWKDDFWGFYFKTNSGLNMLGQLLMKLRKELWDGTFVMRNDFIYL